MRKLLCGITLLLLLTPAFATRRAVPGVPRTSTGTISRSKAVLVKFQKKNPCPSTGRTTGACPGYVKDHVIPLCAGGADSPDNLQWQTKEAAKVKDKTECR